MGAAGEEVCRHGVFQGIAFFFQERHISCQGGRVAGNIDDPAGGHFGEGFDGIGIQTLTGRIHDDHIRDDAPGFQVQGVAPP